MYYLNVSYTDADVVDFKMSSNVPPHVQWVTFLMELGVKFDTSLPMERSQLIGYWRITEHPSTGVTQIRQVIR